MISTRKPEGDPNRCPICGCQVRLEPSWPGRDAPCPQCGHLLWFAQPRRESPEVARKDSTADVLRVVEMRFGQVPGELRDAVEALARRAERQAERERVWGRVLTATSLAELLAER